MNNLPSNSGVSRGRGRGSKNKDQQPRGLGAPVVCNTKFKFLTQIYSLSKRTCYIWKTLVAFYINCKKKINKS